VRRGSSSGSGGPLRDLGNLPARIAAASVGMNGRPGGTVNTCGELIGFIGGWAQWTEWTL
ncbi:MAG: hypothetical protein ACREC6_00525, partial [Hyphomicrobiaceae bacterium]